MQAETTPGQPKVAALLKTIFAQPTKEEARRELRQLAAALRPRFARVAELVENAEEEVLACMDVPEEHWSRLYSTNMLERLMRTIKARTRVVSTFPDVGSVSRLMGAILIKESEEEARRFISEASRARLNSPGKPARGRLTQAEGLTAQERMANYTT